MKVIVLAMVLLLAGCSTVGDVGKNAGITCVQTPGWNGAPVLILYANVDKGVAGTAGGTVNIDCGSLGKATFTDGGKAPAAKVSP